MENMRRARVYSGSSLNKMLLDVCNYACNCACACVTVAAFILGLQNQLLKSSFQKGIRCSIFQSIEYHLPNIKRLCTLEAKKELMNFDYYFGNIQFMRFILSCLNLPNNLSSIQTDVT